MKVWFKALGILLIGGIAAIAVADEGGWQQYGGESGGGSYSKLDQINLENVQSELYGTHNWCRQRLY